MGRGRIRSEKLIRKALREGTLEDFLAKHSWPLIDGDRVLFAYRGEADSVALEHWIYGLPTSQSFERVDDSDLWLLPFELPAESRVEYKIDISKNGRSKWVLDPLNPRKATDPFGANSVCYGQGYQRPAWTLEDPSARKGTLDSITVKSLTLKRRVDVGLYVPARFRRRRRYPLLVVHDGADYLRFAQLKVVLDNLIHRLEIPPMIVALISAQDRLREYGADRRHAEFVVQELVPAVETSFPLIGSPESRGILGASFGAVAALHTAWCFPKFFGRVLVQSGSFAFSEIGDHSRGELFDSVVEFVNQFRDNPGQPTEKVFMTCGVYEPLIYENRSLLPILQKSGLQIRYDEARDGHNWENWRDRLRDGLSWTFPGPLWMVYE